MIIINNLKKTYDTKIRKGFLKYDRHSVEAVRGIDLEIREGQIVGLLGINGAGKTTTIKMLSTLLLPTSGTITVDGVDAVKAPSAVKKRINMVAGGERMIYWRLTGRENLWYFGQLYNIEDRELNNRIDNLLNIVGLSEKGDIPVERYSKGMKQRLQIARGLINNPNYIFMDEPTLGLDAVIAKELRSHIKRIAYNEGKSILLTSHYLQEVEELCEYIYIMNEGKIIAKGSPKELSRLAWEEKVLCIELNNLNSKLHNDISNICSSLKNCTMELDEKNNMYVIKSPVDLTMQISKVLLSNDMPIKNFYTKEPGLEDAILKLSKGA